MERLLRPDRFEGSEETTPAEWTHWYRTFGNFIQSLPTDPAPDKLKLLTNYVSPTAFAHIADCATYESAINVLKNVYVKPRNVIFARHQLATRRQQVSESIDSYVQSLKLLAKECEFKDVTAATYSQEAIRDSFISGLVSPVIRQRLLEKESLTLNEVIHLARSLDSAQRNAEEYSLPAVPGPGNMSAAYAKAGAPGPPSTSSELYAAVSQSRSCFFCGGPRHLRSRCPAKTAVCHKCSKTGHFAIVCRSGRKVKESIGATAAAVAAGEASVPLQECYMNHAQLPAADPPVLAALASSHRSTMPVSVNYLKVNALFDSGSTFSFIHPEVVKNLDIAVYPSTAHITLASSQISSTCGHCFVDLKVNDTLYPKFKLSLLPQLCSEVILGQDFMGRHKSVEFTLNGSLPTLTICSVACMSVDPPSLFPNLSPDLKPVSTSSRKFAKSDANFIHEEVQTLLREGIIEVSQSPWRAQVLVTKDERHKRRMVIDYSRTINRFTLLDAYPIPRIHDLVHKMAKYRVFSKLDLKSAYYQVPLREDEKRFTAFEAEGKLFQFTRVPFGLTNSVAVFQRTINSIITDNGLEATFAYIDDVIVCGETKEDHDRNLQCFKEVASQYSLTLNENKCQYGLTEITYLGYCISNGSLSPDPDRIQPLLDLPIPNDYCSLKRALGLFSYYSVWIPNYSLRIQPLLNCSFFPLSSEAVNCFESLKKDISEASVAAFDETLPLEIETDASSVSVAAVLSQLGRPVAFFSRTLSSSERHQSAVEREATAIMEAVRKWRLFVIGRRFTIVTDQEAVTFMFSSSHSSKIKNEKFLRWRLELSEYQYEIKYRPGPVNFACDTLTRACTAAVQDGSASLEKIHVSLCHPGVTRLYHFVRMKNLPFSLEDVKKVCSHCSICSELKPKFHKPPTGNLIKALKPFDRVSIDFSGPKLSCTKNKYLLVMVDEYSRFPFVFPCSDMSAKTVIHCFLKLFCIFGCPSSVHSDRGTQFMSREVKEFLQSHGVVMTHSSPYHPQGNGQCEREIGTIWKSVCLALKSQKLPITHWEQVLDKVLHSIRSLLCTATNQTPHDRMFSFPRKSSNGYSLPSWLSSPGPVLLRKFVRHSKNDPLVEHVELESATPHYATIRYHDGRTSTVSTKDLAPAPLDSIPTCVDGAEGTVDATLPDTPSPILDMPITTGQPTFSGVDSPASIDTSGSRDSQPAPPPSLRRSTRVRHAPDRLTYN